MVSPRSTESSTAEKFLDASDAVTSSDRHRRPHATTVPRLHRFRPAPRGCAVCARLIGPGAHPRGL
jgi:hypothetical protein